MDADWFVDLEGAGFEYPGSRPVLVPLSLRINAGSRVAVMGRSGSGKTTLLRLLGGLLRPTHGYRSVSSPAPKIGFLPQEDPVLPWRSVWRNLTLVAADPHATSRLAGILNSVRLPAPTYGDRYPNQLSGGERRRLGLAMVFAAAPQLFLLDEVGSSLDEPTRFAMVDLVIQTAAQLGAAVVAITHDAEEALLFGDTLLLLDGSGKVEQSTVDLPSGRTSQYRFTDEFQKHRAGILAKARG